MDNKKTYNIVLDSLELGLHTFDFQLDNDFFAALENSEVLSGQASVSASLQLRQYDFDLQITVKGLVQVTCDRCLDAMDVAVYAEESQWDFDEQPSQLDLQWLAYELIIVNLPLVHSHQDGGCNPEMDALLQSHLCTNVDDTDDIYEDDEE